MESTVYRQAGIRAKPNCDVRLSATSTIAGVSVRFAPSPLPLPLCDVERLPLRVDSDVRVVLQHPARQMAADRFEQVIGDAHLLRSSRISARPTGRRRLGRFFT